jgi:hypothetical protein
MALTLPYLLLIRRFETRFMSGAENLRSDDFMSEFCYSKDSACQIKLLDFLVSNNEHAGLWEHILLM